MSKLIWISFGVWSVFFPDDRKRNAASETMSLRMLVNVAFRCAIMFVLKECCHLSTSLGVVCVRVSTTIRESNFSSVNCGKKLWGWLATAEHSLCRPRKPTMSTNKTKKVKMATKSCPECDQQVRQNIFKVGCQRFWFCLAYCGPKSHKWRSAFGQKWSLVAAWLHTCKH